MAVLFFEFQIQARDWMVEKAKIASVTTDNVSLFEIYTRNFKNRKLILDI